MEVPMRSAAFLLLVSITGAPIVGHAGGSNYGVTPGAKKEIAGMVLEWPVPTPNFARDPAPGPDGNIYIAVMHGNKIARFDTKGQTFKEWDLPTGARPHGLLVDEKGIVWYTGNGNGTIGELNPATGEIKQHKTPSGGGAPHTIVLDQGGALWFTGQSGGYLGRLDRATGKITEYRMSGGPYGLAIDKQGQVWVCRMNADRLGKLDPRTGQQTELYMGQQSMPRRIATAPDGTLWVTLYGNGKLAHVDPAANKVVKEYEMPLGKAGGPYAVTIDAQGRVWANEIQSDTVAVLEPKSDRFRVIKLPSKNVGIRKSIVDADGRFWYMGSHNGRLGVIE
jgi:virginiamycin B lyase